MANVPLYDIAFNFAVVLALLVVIFVELRQLRRLIEETNGLYKVMLDYVLGEHRPIAADREKSDDENEPPT